MIDSLLIAVHAFVSHVLTSFSVNEMLEPLLNYIYICIYRRMQSSSNELSTPVLISLKCEQIPIFNTYELNSLTYIGIACGYEVTLLGWCKVGWVSISV